MHSESGMSPVRTLSEARAGGGSLGRGRYGATLVEPRPLFDYGVLRWDPSIVTGTWPQVFRRPLHSIKNLVGDKIWAMWKGITMDAQFVNKIWIATTRSSVVHSRFKLRLRNGDWCQLISFFSYQVQVGGSTKFWHSWICCPAELTLLLGFKWHIRRYNQIFLRWFKKHGLPYYCGSDRDSIFHIDFGKSSSRFV